MASEWLTQLLCNLTVRSVLLKAGKGGEMPYVEAIVLLLIAGEKGIRTTT